MHMCDMTLSCQSSESHLYQLFVCLCVCVCVCVWLCSAVSISAESGVCACVRVRLCVEVLLLHNLREGDRSLLPRFSEKRGTLKQNPYTHGKRPIYTHEKRHVWNERQGRSYDGKRIHTCLKVDLVIYMTYRSFFSVWHKDRSFISQCDMNLCDADDTQVFLQCGMKRNPWMVSLDATLGHEAVGHKTLGHEAVGHKTLFMYIQGGKDPEDALSCRSYSAKELLIMGLFCGKWPIKIRHPLTRRHTVSRSLVVAHSCSSCHTVWHEERPMWNENRECSCNLEIRALQSGIFQMGRL